MRRFLQPKLTSDLLMLRYHLQFLQIPDQVTQMIRIYITIVSGNSYQQPLHLRNATFALRHS